MSPFLRHPVLWLGGAWLAMNMLAAWALGLWNETEPVLRRSYVTPRAEHLYEHHDLLKRPAGSDTREASGQNVLAFRVLRPASSAPPVPLVLFLHGAGERGRDNASQLSGLPDQLSEPDMQSRFPCICVAPQCPQHDTWNRHMEELGRLVEHWRADPQVDPCRIYLTGLSMGGFGSWELAARRPDLFACAVPICGGGRPDSAVRLATLPIWAVHGADDPVIPVARTRDMIAAVQAAGGEPRYTELPGVAHNSWTESYRDPDGVIPWMFRQVRKDCPQ